MRTSEQGGTRGYDGAKKVCGRKRHLLVDTLGLVLLAVITAANAQDREGARTLLMEPMPAPYSRGFVDCGNGAGSDWRSCENHKISEDLRWCRGGGLWNVHSPGWGAIVGSSRIMSACRKQPKR